MSKYNKGILGPFSGKLGTVVGSTYRGEPVMKSLPVKSSKEPVQSQIDQLFIFALVTSFLGPLNTLIKTTFTAKKKTMSPMNAAVQYNLKNSISGVSPAFELDYDQVKLANGNLPGFSDPTVVALAAGKLTVTWDAANDDQIDPDEKALRNSDTLRLVTYCPSTDGYYTSGFATHRSAGTFTTRVPNAEAGDTVHVWVVFVAANNKAASTSQYLGTIVALD
jgi:hypothetical protein